MFQIVRDPGSSGSVIKQNIYKAKNSDGDWEMEYLTFPSLEDTGMVSHLFTTRLGGVSDGIYSTLNLSFSRGDDEKKVLANYERVAKVLGCSIQDIVTSHQTHTTNIRHVTGKDAGKGVVIPRDYENIDGLITNEPGLALATFYADCVPLYFVDTRNRAIGLAHSGWRGTVGEMGRHMVEAMKDAFGTKPEDIVAAIGPSICQTCYEVSEDVAEQFIGKTDNIVLPGKVPGKYQLNLWLANATILQNAGIPAEQISITDICTCHNPEYLYSHRASHGKRGNLGAFLMLK